MEGPLHSLVVHKAHQDRFMGDLCSGSSGGGSGDGSFVASSVCLLVELAAGPENDHQEGPEHRYDMSSLMAQLPPIRRGLSRYYDGKSQSFASLGSVKVVEDLPKPVRRRRNGCKKEMIAAGLHGSSSLSRVIRKATRM